MREINVPKQLESFNKTDEMNLNAFSEKVHKRFLNELQGGE